MKSIHIASLMALLIFLSLAIPVMAADTVIINSTGNVIKTTLEPFAVQSNGSGYGTNSKTLWVNTSNTTVVVFTIYNFSVYQINELRLNGTSQAGYITNSTGVLIINRTFSGNKSMRLTPAVAQGGYNFTWGWFNETTVTGITNLSGKVLIGAGVTESSDQVTIRIGANRRLGVRVAVAVAGAVAIHGIDDAYASNIPLEYRASKHIFSTGNVGVGNTSPVAPLVVAGIIESTTGGFKFPDQTTQINAPLSVQTNYTTTRTIDTVYQNTGASGIIVQGTLTSSGGCPIAVKAGAANPPTTIVSASPFQTGEYLHSVTFTVLPKYYYTLTTTDCAALSMKGFYEYS